MKKTLYILLVCLATLAGKSCGFAIDERIFNGYDAFPGELPYQVLLILETVDNQESFCGATLISDEYVVTAAHCVEDVRVSHVHLGLSNVNDSRGVVVLDVPSSDTVIHPKYNRKAIVNDIALLHLPRRVNFTSQIRPAYLPIRAWANPSTFDDAYATVSGYGQTYNTEPGVPHKYLQFRTVRVMPHSKCKSYPRYSIPITDGMICTDRRINSGHCPGDSGGPLVFGNYLIGIVSWGSRPCVNEAPSVYVNVAYYLDWIAQNSNIVTY